MKELIKNIVAGKTSCMEKAVIVNSYGRSGSTFLTKSIIQSSIIPKNKFLTQLSEKSIRASAWNLKTTKFKKGRIYKTHDYPVLRNYSDTVMIYTFSDPIDTIISLLHIYKSKGDDWMKKHFNHLKVIEYKNFNEILNEDILSLERHLTSWLEDTTIPKLFIRYESMWENQETISDFIGIKLKFEEFNNRNKRALYSSYIPQIERTYANLIKKVNGLDDIFEI